MSGKLVDIFLIYQFLRRLVQPFTSWKAYELGIIDADGKVLKRRDELKTPEERNAFGYFDILMMNLKKLLAMVPAGKSVLASYAAAILLLKEHKSPRKELVENRELLLKEWGNQIRLAEQEEMPKSLRKFLEEEGAFAPANNVGGGCIAGTDEHPPMKTRRTRMLRRRKPKTFKESVVRVLKEKTCTKINTTRRKHGRLP